MTALTLSSLNVAPAFPELFLLFAACVILVADLFIPEHRREQTFWLTLFAIGGTALLALMMVGTGGTEYALAGMYVADPVAYVLKLLACIAVAITLVFSRQYAKDRDLLRGEWCVLALFSLLGQMIMMSAANLLVVYLGLELMSLSLYALVALRRDSAVATEAAMKYFVLGALASGFLLYGMSMIYGATGTLDLREIAQASAQATANTKLLALGTVFIVSGIAFKIGAVPFHMWVPDVYQGSPTAVTLMIAGAPKLAAFAMILRLMVDGLITMSGDWQQMFEILVVLSLAIGNITAIAQTNLKRMLAFSTIAQMGFMLLGFVSGAGDLPERAGPYSTAMFYSIVYVFTTLGTFGVIMLLAREGFECDQISDLKGLNKRSPWMAFVVLLLMFSLAGVPPTVGFYAKLAVLQSAVGAGHIGVSIFAVLMSLIGAFYYLRVVKVAYFDEPEDNSVIVTTADSRVLLALSGGFVLVFGIFGNALLSWCYNSLTIALTS
jgi:NADH-quinone oxidoreductase subunit N